MTTTATTDVAIVDPEFSDAERYALAAFLTGYRVPADGKPIFGALLEPEGDQSAPPEKRGSPSPRSAGSAKIR